MNKESCKIFILFKKPPKTPFVSWEHTSPSFFLTKQAIVLTFPFYYCFLNPFSFSAPFCIPSDSSTRFAVCLTAVDASTTQLPPWHVMIISPLNACSTCLWNHWELCYIYDSLVLSGWHPYSNILNWRKNSRAFILRWNLFLSHLISSNYPDKIKVSLYPSCAVKCCLGLEQGFHCAISL